MANLRVRELIEESKKAGKKVTQTGLAKAAGISQASMWAIVEGKTKAPDPQILLVIAEVFTETLGREITIDDLIEKEDKRTPNTPPESEPTPGPSLQDGNLLEAIERLENHMGKGFNEVKQQIAEVKDEISKLN